MAWNIPPLAELPKTVEEYFPIPPWKHQAHSVREVLRVLETYQAVTLCIPTGGGKSLCFMALINLAAEFGLKASVYTNRRLLTKQTAKGMGDKGIEFGVRAASMADMADYSAPIQISSMQTEISRCLQGRGKLHDADLVIIDEAHLMATGGSLKVIQHHLAAGAKVVLVTATPLGLGHIAAKVVVGAKNSELRACGAHVLAHVKTLHEMDLTRVSKVRSEDGDEAYDLQSIRDNAWSQAVVGHILSDYFLFNPEQKMAMGVAPGVPESRALAAYFDRNGVKAAHIDAKEVWVDGEFKTDNAKGSQRDDVMRRWRSGEIKIVWTCQVLREGIDLPELYHLIIATPFGSFKDYIQVVGRVIRKSEATPDHVIIQDHCGNPHNHGSPNADVDWEELYNMTQVQISEHRKQKKQEQEEAGETASPCPHCGSLVRAGRKCPPPPIGCGEEIDKTNPRHLRFVVQKEGQLVSMSDNQFQSKRKVSTASVEQKQWDSIYYAARNSKSPRGTNFNQLRARYKKEFGTYPPSGLDRMPRDKADWQRKVRDVPKDSLTFTPPN
jgi:superfamily II DNA or RNA helicase